MQIIPEFVNPPKEGARSGSIKATDGRYYGFEAKNYPTASWEKGVPYEVEVKSREYNGKTYWDVTKRHGAARQESGSSSGNGATPPPLTDRWWLPFVSNQVAHAIASGKVQDPDDMKVWGSAARLAIMEIDNPRPRKSEPDDGWRDSELQ